MKPNKYPAGKETKTKFKLTLPESEFLIGVGIGMIIAHFMMIIITIILSYILPLIK